MIRALRRVLLLALLLTAFTLTAKAQVSSDHAVKELSVRLNNIGAEASIEIKGTPGSLVSVELITPGSTIGQAYTTDNLKAILAGIDMIELSDSGNATYSYVVEEETGLYTFRVSGAVDSVSYTAQNNAPELNEPNVFFAEMWSEGYGSIYSDHLQGPVWIRKYMLTGSVEAWAKQIKKQMDMREPGRRYMYIHTDICQDMLTEGDSFLWQTEDVEAMAALIDNFLCAYYEAGGELDGIYTDNEAGMSTWQIRKDEDDDGEITDDIDANLANILNDDLYYDVIRPRLAERGFNFDINTNAGLCEIYDVGYYQKHIGSDYARQGMANYLIWLAVLDSYKNECLNKGIYDVAAKYYPEVYYANYQSVQRIAASYGSGTHKYYLGGNRTQTGTHSSPVLYNSAKEDATTYYPDGTKTYLAVGEGSPYLEVRDLTNGMRGAVLASDDGKVMPWVVSSTYHTKDYNHINSDPAYFYEYLFHVAMCNPDALLFYGPRYYSTDTEEQVSGNIQGMTQALEEFNTYAAKSDARTLVEDTVRSEDYILSGMYTDGRNLWRITPDNTVISPEDFLLASGADPTFCVSGQTITFPGGTILENVYSEHGYWVETAAGVYPEITYDEVPEGCTVTFKYYDKFGIELSEPVDTSDIYTVAVYYDGILENAEGMAMNVAHYDDKGLVSVGPLKTPMWSGIKGRLISHNIKNTGKSKLLIWESLESLTPLTPALPWVYAN